VEYLAGALVVCAVLAYVGYPLVRHSQTGAALTGGEGNSADERAAIYRELVELELDHRIGKVTVADFRELSDGLLARAAALIVAEGTETGTIEEQVEHEIAAMRTALRLTPSATTSERQP
jgi:hypothetical protein